jgi:hypothetical protein
VEFLHDLLCPRAVPEQLVTSAVSKHAGTGIVAIENLAVRLGDVKPSEVAFEDIALLSFSVMISVCLCTRLRRMKTHPITASVAMVRPKSKATALSAVSQVGAEST